VTPEPGLPPQVYGLLTELVADGFTAICCGPKEAPHALVASYAWAGWVDLVTVRDFRRACSARVPVPEWGTVDVFAPELVVWAYEGPAEGALRALLGLVHPEHPDAPRLAYPAPASLHVPRAEQRPASIRPPSPGRAGRRARRLRAALEDR